MPPSDESLGQLEREVLQFIAGQPPQSVREVADHFAGTSGQARTTILTVMERLRKKGYLKRKKVDDVHRYSATVTREALLDRLVERFVDDVLGGAVSPFLAYLSRSESLTAAESKKLNELIDGIQSREEGTQP
jgi:predicted transcriptional regulator